MNVSRFIVSALLFTSSLFSEETLNYISMTAGKKVTTEWTIKEEGDKLIITGKSSDNTTAMLETSKDYTLEKLKQTGRNLTASRQGNTLTVSETVKQTSKTKSYDIGTTPWVQEFTFGFKDFLASNKREYKFEIIRAEDLDLHDMIATKEEIEELEIDQTHYTAQKMKITLQGFKRRFWKAEVWYDMATHKMLRYKANEGPGTPITETVFVKAP